ncbi:MAG: hypothetical protein K0R02_722 [Rickettsiaceae bacterium]|jgi:hypothetical protein|nr:hypothetical protein [Rickettsiaceae bacterium]
MPTKLDELLEDVRSNIEHNIVIEISNDGFKVSYSERYEAGPSLSIAADENIITQQQAIVIKNILETNNPRVELSIYNINDSAVIDSLIENLSNFPKLISLNLGCTLNKEKTIVLFKKLQDFPNLFYLALKDINLTVDEAKYLVYSIEKLSKLEILILGNDKLTLEGVKILANAIAKSKNLNKLQFLSATNAEEIAETLEEALKENLSLRAIEIGDMLINHISIRSVNNRFHKNDLYKTIQSYIKRNVYIAENVKPTYQKTIAVFFKQLEIKNEQSLQDTKEFKASLTSEDIHVLLNNVESLELLTKLDHIDNLLLLNNIEQYAEKNYFKFKEVCKSIIANNEKKYSLANIPNELIFKIFSYNIYRIKEDLLESRQKKVNEPYTEYYIHENQQITKVIYHQFPIISEYNLFEDYT